MIYLLFCAIIATEIEHLRYGFCCAWNIKIDNFRFAAIFQVKIPFQDGAAPLLNRELHLPLNRSCPPCTISIKITRAFYARKPLEIRLSGFFST